ncbi:nibrin [Notolabrus celidotus]|uniref:nibrin n=1 Tax=Notolabrus celidotus TaxID=1203425 RepID=UPI0014901A62|nr:nibrin [Notolabrus celidotus]
MWILTALQSEGETHYLLSGKEYVVGRKNCDILLPSDQSISRAHAHLSATDQTLNLRDTSKYGTFVNSQRLAENSSVNLTSGDEVTFGVFHSKFSVEHLQPVVCSSCLDNDGKASISQVLLALSGKLVNSWTQDCTHLVMPTAKVTIKTISALLCCRPIVKPEFFSELNRAAQQKLPPPKAESFLPELDEPSLNKEDVNLRAIPFRKQLFSGKTFIFLSAKQRKRLNAAVGFGGGKSQLLEEGLLPHDLLQSPQSCVVDVTTGSSQTLLSSSAIEWANSVKKIVERNGLRVITESEIGLAAIYASCDRYCNPSSVILDSESAPKIAPKIPSASLSQSGAVDETVLPAASQNITAYVANTETSQRMELYGVTGVTAVGETPEKKQSSQIQGPKPAAQKKTSHYVVEDTICSGSNTLEKKHSERKRPESKPTGAGNSDMWSQPSFQRTNGGTKTFQQKQSPQKQRVSPQVSPQKQSTLTNFFTPVNKKRPLEDELSTVMSEPKRPLLESSTSLQKPHSSKETYSGSERVPPAASQESAADLFLGLPQAESGMVSHSIQEERGSRKRKEMEAAIPMDELESIMSEDMDCFDEQPSVNKGHQAQSVTLSSTKQKQEFYSVEASSSSKRQRIHVEGSETDTRPQRGLEKESGSQIKHSKTIQIKTEQVNPSEYRTSFHESIKPPEVPQTRTASTSKDVQPFEDDEAFAKDIEQLTEDVCQPKQEIKTPLKPSTIKQEVHEEAKIDEDLPKKLVLVEFRSLTVTEPPKTKPQRVRDNGFTKNFKCFRKMCVPGAQGSPHVIRGSDLLAHNKGKNSDLDEWLKDAAEEERQNKQDETAGDDLFRYNPSKLAKRR